MNACLSEKLEKQNAARAEPASQARWAALPIAGRLAFVRCFRELVAEHAKALAGAAARASGRTVAEKLASEVLPLVDACRWLERRAGRVLSARVCGRSGRPLWLHGVSFEVQRKPFGTLLVIGPGNYPLFLPAVQALHGLTAGNAVLVKPAPGMSDVATRFAELAWSAGLDRKLLKILPESVEAAQTAIADKVIFTGSSTNGRDILSRLARTNTPSVVELSGEDVVLVLADADRELVIRALKFGLRLNGGASCIAPRRVLAVAPLAVDLFARIADEGLTELEMEEVADDESAVARIAAGPFGLGVSIFSGDVSRARSLGSRLACGFVVVNDLIVPTADPRMPFGGVKASGFGVTRGDEGLLEMTYPHVVLVRSGQMRPHFDEHREGDEHLFSSYIAMAYGRRSQSLRALRSFIQAALQREKSKTVKT
jgi:acyl-CoA reductase-like NAD-dependent aldehyde dehydrogenase